MSNENTKTTNILSDEELGCVSGGVIDLREPPTRPEVPDLPRIPGLPNPNIALPGGNGGSISITLPKCSICGQTTVAESGYDESGIMSVRFVCPSCGGVNH